MLITALQRLAERRIAEAVANGDFDDLPGSGLPLDLQEETLVPAEQAMAFRILRNAGYVPDEVIARREIAELEVVAQDASDAKARVAAAKRLSVLRTRLAGRSTTHASSHTYRAKVLQKLAR